MRTAVPRTLVCMLVALCCVSCSSSDPASPSDPAYSGAWGLESIDSESGTRVYSKLDSLSGDQDGYMFDSGGSLMVRNAGWCGTPPLAFSNFEGSWVEEADDILFLTYPHWDEMRDFRLVILSLNDAEMHCRVDEVE